MTDASTNNWCVELRCNTCFNHDFREAVASIPDLQSELETIDLQELTSRGFWLSALHATAVGRILNWNRILMAWLPFAESDVRFADDVFFYLVSRLPFQPPACDQWLEACIDLAFKTKDASLIESLVYVLGPKFKTYSDLVALARDVSPTHANLREALVKEGLMPPLPKLAPEKCKIAGKNLFGAIRRNDIKAVRALMAREADLTVKDEMARTPLEYAQSLAQERLDLVAIIDPASAEEGTVADTDKQARGESEGQSE